MSARRHLKLLTLALLKGVGAFALARRATRRELRILCYHAFEREDEASFRPALFMRGPTFARRLELVRRAGFRVIGLDEAVERLEQHTLRGDELVITVDDGFESFLRIAVPELERHGFVSTLYLTSYFVTRDAPVFPLVVQYLFWKSTRASLDLQDARWSPADAVERSDAPAWQRCIDDCIAYGESELDQPGREALCRELGARLGVDYERIASARMLHLLRPEQIVQAQSRGVAIELHTHRHRFPPDDAQACRAEIELNRSAIEAWTGRSPTHFCYPSGEWDQRHWSILDAAGVKSATTCVPGLAAEGAPRHALSRILDHENMHDLEFEAALSGLSSLLARLRRRTAAV